MKDFKILTNFEKDTLKFLNSFRENPHFFENDLVILRDGLLRYRPNDPFIKDINIFLKQLKSQRRMRELELNDSLSRYAKEELKKFMNEPSEFPPARRGAECNGIVSHSYLGENPGVTYTMDAQDPLNVVEKIIFNEKDSHKVGKLILTSIDYSQLGISHETNKKTGENYTVLIFADNYVDDDNEELPDGDISRLKIAFDLLDYDKEGRVKPNHVLDVMNELGFNESDPVIFDIVKGMDSSPYVSWPKFANYVYDRMSDRYTYSGLKDIFNIFKDNVSKKNIDIPAMRNICESCGISKTDDQLLKMMNDCCGKDNINFEDFCQIMGIEFSFKSKSDYEDPHIERTMKIINRSFSKKKKINISSLETDRNTLNQTILDKLSAERSIKENNKSLIDNDDVFKKKKMSYEIDDDEEL